MEKITVVGLGNMGAALVRGLLKSSAKNPLPIEVYDVDKHRVDQVVGTSGARGLSSLSDIQQHKNVLIFCVKPQDLPTIAKTLGGKLESDNLIISILAGKKTSTIAEELRYEGPIIRAMPNIAAVIGEAATAMCANEKAEESHKNRAEQIFKAVGEAYWTKEALMDSVTGLSGSGPAYIYMVIEALADGGLKMGMPKELALKLATQTVLGSAAMVKHMGLHPAILKDQVTTPAGTTISALHELEERGLRSMFVSAVEKATLRSQELGRNS
jgi:pyrroline-5-carboxylate reductase